jgi:hypothetical protein
MGIENREDVMALPQGDVGLLGSDVAQRLLVSKELARLAYVAADDTPRVFPMLFHWTGTEVVLSTFGGCQGSRPSGQARRRYHYRRRIHSARGAPHPRAGVGHRCRGDSPEYALALRRYGGEEQAAAQVATVDHPGTKMVRIAVHPAWVGVLDFKTRLPGGTSMKDFERRGRL